MKPLTLLICALGGEGGGVLTEWLVDTARHAGYAAQATSIPGVAQRTGATTYYIEVFPLPIAQLGGRRPVFSLNPVPGALDAIVSSELLETARQVTNGMPSPDRTMVISSIARTLTTQERMQLGDGRADAMELVHLVKRFSREHHLFDMGGVAKECGTVVSAVMLGAIAGSGLFPFTREQYEEVVRRSGAGAEASLRGFARAFEIVQRHAGWAAWLPTGEELIGRAVGGGAAHPARDEDASAMKRGVAGAMKPAPQVARAKPLVKPAMVSSLPSRVREIAELGYARMADYQDLAYAELYVRRVHEVLAAESDADPEGEHRCETARETARWLALWMAFDDIVRVASLKGRRSRFARIRREVKANDDDLLKVYDHFKPGVPEFAGLMPQGIADRLLAWDRRRAQPWALPLQIGTHGVFGMLALRVLASLKWLRVRGSRFALEQRMIENWMRGVIDGTRRDWQLGHEIALCGRLIKGYGATNERGKANLLHVVDHLAHGADAKAAARAIAAVREAALADEAGNALDAALAQHGAPPRPVKEQPIRWVRKPAAKTAAKA